MESGFARKRERPEMTMFGLVDAQGSYCPAAYTFARVLC